MIERETQVQTADGAMTTFFAAPEEPGRFPTVLVYMDACWVPKFGHAGFAGDSRSG